MQQYPIARASRRSKQPADKSKASAVGDVYYGDNATKYQKKRESSRRWQLEHKVVEKALAALPEGLSVLDVPFGTGRFVPIYRKRRMKITGLDISHEMFNAARKELGPALDQCDLRVGNATSLPFEDRSMDLIVCFRFLQNIIPLADVRTCLSEFARVADCALLEFEVRNENAAPTEMAPDPGRPIRDKLTDRELRALLSDHGLEVVRRYKIIARETKTYCAYLCRSNQGDARWLPYPTFGERLRKLWPLRFGRGRYSRDGPASCQIMRNSICAHP